MTKTYELYSVRPVQVGLTELEYETLRAIGECNGEEFFPDGWPEAAELLLERELVDVEHHPPTLNAVGGPRGTQSDQGEEPKRPWRSGFFLTPSGHTVISQVGDFRREVVEGGPRRWWRPRRLRKVPSRWEGPRRWWRPSRTLVEVFVVVALLAAIVYTWGLQ